MDKIDEQEVEAVAFLLKRGFGFDQYGELTAYGSPADAKNYVVRFGVDIAYDEKCEEKLFKDPKEAARFYVEYKKRHQLS